MATIRNNVVIIQSEEILSAEYIENSARVSKGQPFVKSPTIVLVGDTLSILFKTGRKK